LQRSCKRWYNGWIEAKEVGGEQHKQHQGDPASACEVHALARIVHVPVRVDLMMKQLPVDRSWRTIETAGVEHMMERPPVVSRSDLKKKKKNRSKNFKISGEPWLRSGGGEDQSNCKEVVNGGTTSACEVHALARVVHVPTSVDPMMKSLSVDRSWRTL
jgi:hypothetical protein